jgi:hypothetical protein
LFKNEIGESKMDYMKMPHDGEIFIHITNKDIVGKIEKTCDDIDNQNQELFDLTVSEAKKLGFEGVYSTSSMGTFICKFMAYVTVPKALSKSWDEKMHSWRDKKYDKSLKKLNAMNESVKGSRKFYLMKKGYYVDSETGRTLAVSEITPKSCSPFRSKGGRLIPVKSINDVFRDEILKLEKMDCVIEKNPYHSKGSGSHLMRQMYVTKECGEWFGVIPISKGDDQPKELKLPKGMKRLTMSGYWKLKEKLALSK